MFIQAKKGNAFNGGKKFKCQNKAEFDSKFLDSCLSQISNPFLTLTKHFKQNFVYNTVLRAFENNADVSNITFQTAEM